MNNSDACDVSHRGPMAGTAVAAAILTMAGDVRAQAGSASPAGAANVSNVPFTVNGRVRTLAIDTRTTPLDALREHLQLTGTKKGCDHG